jgi:Protein of unknown function (DUF3289)
LLIIGTTTGLGDVASSFHNRFMANTGGIAIDNRLTTKVMNSPEYKNFIKVFANELKSKLIANNNQVPSQVIDLKNLHPSWGNSNILNGLAIFLHNSEQTKISYENYVFNPTTKEWSMDIFVEISDNFGLDRNDVLTYQNKNVGFAAWWVLQHQRGYKPFKVKMLITQKIKGKL